ncbi:hypothetical protein ARMSODRAFT_976384 [Armillaria solidipes]|uniref:C2H2-type domain-containing protein n=1 Tax=Armillaria solidipes TaxID=1076256 RepID=A0A2H3BEM9_9AGAR|nr:hypothetical protein ARMSODRAFT_976384 [Armillaria solidipes]
MGLPAEQNQQERYSCDQCDLKFQNSTGLADHRKTNQQPESSSFTLLGQEDPKAQLATTAAFPDSTMEALPDPLLDELIFAEWNDEFISKHFPALYAMGFCYVPEVPEMSEVFWFSILSSPPNFGENGYESFLHLPVDFPALVTSVDENTSTTQ